MWVATLLGVAGALSARRSENQEGHRMQKLEHDFDRFDHRAVDFAAEHAIQMLRLSLAVVYLWFGALKIFNASPVADLVENMAFVVPRRMFVRLMGIWEITIGTALLFRIALRPTLALYFLQLTGTFMVFFARPRDGFERGNPLRLTKTGEFVVKNLVLLAAGVAVGSTIHRKREDIGRSSAEPAGVKDEAGGSEYASQAKIS
jgi:putative oxidoreductase